MQDSTNKINFHFHPADLETNLDADFANFRQQEIQNLETIFQQNVLQIDKIDIRIERNGHLGNNTYSCTVNLTSPNLSSGFHHTEEGKSYQSIIRSCIKTTVEFVRRAKEKKVEAKNSLDKDL